MNDLKKEYINYVTLCKLEEEFTSSKNHLYERLNDSEIGKFYFSLDEKQKEKYKEIHPNEDIKRFEKNKEFAKETERKISHFLEETLYKKCFPFSQSNRLNIFVFDGVNTYNAITGESTENLNIDDALKLFVQEVIRKNYNVDEDYTKDDIPLIKVIVEKLKERKVSLEGIEFSVSYQVYNTHKIENNNKTYNSPYLDIEKMKDNLREEESIINNSDTRFKFLLKEQLLAAYYELEMLSGKSIKELYSQITTMEDSPLKEGHLLSLTRAYYNLSDIDFRNNSGYFANITDSMHAFFATSIKEINEKILTMKKR